MLGRRLTRNAPKDYAGDLGIGVVANLALTQAVQTYAGMLGLPRCCFTSYSIWDAALNAAGKFWPSWADLNKYLQRYRREGDGGGPTAGGAGGPAEAANRAAPGP